MSSTTRPRRWRATAATPLFLSRWPSMRTGSHQARPDGPPWKRRHSRGILLSQRKRATRRCPHHGSHLRCRPSNQPPHKPYTGAGGDADATAQGRRTKSHQARTAAPARHPHGKSNNSQDHPIREHQNADRSPTQYTTMSERGWSSGNLILLRQHLHLQDVAGQKPR